MTRTGAGYGRWNATVRGGLKRVVCGGLLLHSFTIASRSSGAVETLEAALHVRGQLGIKGVWIQNMVTETFQQASGQVLQAAKQLPRRAAAVGGQAPQQTAGFENLQDQVGDLHEVVVRFEQLRVGAEGMFEIQAAVF